MGDGDGDGDGGDGGIGAAAAAGLGTGDSGTSGNIGIGGDGGLGSIGVGPGGGFGGFSDTGPGGVSAYGGDTGSLGAIGVGPGGGFGGFSDTGPGGNIGGFGGGFGGFSDTGPGSFGFSTFGEPGSLAAQADAQAGINAFGFSGLTAMGFNFADISAPTAAELGFAEEEPTEEEPTVSTLAKEQAKALGLFGIAIPAKGPPGVQVAQLEEKEAKTTEEPKETKEEPQLTVPKDAPITTETLQEQPHEPTQYTVVVSPHTNPVDATVTGKVSGTGTGHGLSGVNAPASPAVGPDADVSAPATAQIPSVSTNPALGITTSVWGDMAPTAVTGPATPAPTNAVPGFPAGIGVTPTQSMPDIGVTSTPAQLATGTYGGISYGTSVYGSPADTASQLGTPNIPQSVINAEFGTLGATSAPTSGISKGGKGGPGGAAVGIPTSRGEAMENEAIQAVKGIAPKGMPFNYATPIGPQSSVSDTVGKALSALFGISTAEAASINIPNPLGPGLSGYGGYGGHSQVPGEGTSVAVGSQGGGLGGSTGGVGAGGQIGNPNQIGIDDIFGIPPSALVGYPQPKGPPVTLRDPFGLSKGFNNNPPSAVPGPQAVPSPQPNPTPVPVPSPLPSPVPNIIGTPNPADLGYPALGKGNNLGTPSPNPPGSITNPTVVTPVPITPTEPAPKAPPISKEQQEQVQKAKDDLAKDLKERAERAEKAKAEEAKPPPKEEPPKEKEKEKEKPLERPPPIIKDLPLTKEVIKDLETKIEKQEKAKPQPPPVVVPPVVAPQPPPIAVPLPQPRPDVLAPPPPVVAPPPAPVVAPPPAPVVAPPPAPVVAPPTAVVAAPPTVPPATLGTGITGFTPGSNLGDFGAGGIPIQQLTHIAQATSTPVTAVTAMQALSQIPVNPIGLNAAQLQQWWAQQVA